jgi:putative flippase GtrA
MTTATISQGTPEPRAGDKLESIASAVAKPPVLDVVVPVFNEEAQLEITVRRLDEHLRRNFPYSYRITVADNASTDSTDTIARRMSRQLPNVRSVRLELKGRGRALSRVWMESDADVLAYMDVDLSTDLAALLPLVAPLISGHSDLAIGSRLARGSRVVRGPKRELISRCYNLVLRGTLAARFSDAQCGFKAIRSDVARRLLPMVQDTGWFFDTEMLVLAEKAGLRIHEVPVDWVDDPDSRVDIVATAVADLKGVVRVGKALATGAIPLRDITGPTSRQLVAESTPPGLVRQMVRFGAIGIVSTLAYLALFVLLRPSLGAQGANFLALLVTAIGNTAANRRLTFGVTGARGATKHQLQGLAVFGLGLLLTSGSLAALNSQAGTPSRALEASVLVGANLAATLLRFLLMRAWVFRASLATQAIETTGSTR